MSAAVPRSREILRCIAGVLPTVENPSPGQTRGGAADRPYRDARSEERLRLLHGLEVPALIPTLTTWKDEHGTLGRVELVEGHIRQNPDATYGCDRIAGSSDRTNLVTAGGLLSVGIIDAGDHEAGLPVGQSIEDE